MLSLSEKLQLIQSNAIQQSLAQNKRGIEKESLRVTADGKLSQKAHPSSLGSTLTHPHITTDYSEALLEFITPVCDSIDEVLKMLTDIHHYTYKNIGDELLWVNSMPCIMGEDKDIPIAQYGSSNSGRMKTVYREGLGVRYGRRMQTIAGIHYNFSVADDFWPQWQQLLKNEEPLQNFISDQYFSLIRNFRRHAWLLVYLFGASPAICKTFITGHDDSWLEHHPERPTTLFKEFGTSLRMSDIGYQNNAQAGLKICYNSLDTYVETLTDAIRTPHKEYEEIGVEKNGHWQQLNANILQIENEYYSDIRPKRVASSGERPTLALKRRGVEYIEMRCIDLDPFEPTGINANTAAFLEAFAVWCLLSKDECFEQECLKQADENLKQAVLGARQPGLKLQRSEGEITLQDWGREAIDEIQQVACLLDEVQEGNRYQQAVTEIGKRIEAPETTPSARILQQLNEQQSSFYNWASHKALEHEAYFKKQQIDDSTQQYFTDLANNSIQQQADIEANDSVSFEEFVASYFEGDE